MEHASHSSIGAVLSNYELLESILAYLDFFDLVRAQQVCKQWRDLASRSQLLRYKLFLEAKVNSYGQHSLNSSEADVSRHDRSGVNRRLPIATRGNPLLTRDYSLDRIQAPCEIKLRYHHVKHILTWSAGLWQDMLVSKPPPKRIKVSIGRAPWSGDFVIVEDETGVRLGKVVGRMLDLLSGDDRREEDLMRRMEMLGVTLHIYEQ